MALEAKIALEGATLAFDKLYSYIIPSYLSSTALKGCRVLVPFGKANSKKQGMIFSVDECKEENLKEIISVIDQNPVLSSQMLKLCEYMKETLFCTYFDAVRTVLPAGLGYKFVDYYSANPDFISELLDENEKEIYNYLVKNGEKSYIDIKTQFATGSEILEQMCEKEAIFKEKDVIRKVGDSTQKWVKICDGFDLSEKLTKKQSCVVELLQTAGEASVKEVCYFTGVSQGVIEGLIKKGILISYKKRIFRNPFNECKIDRKQIVLTDEQQIASDGIKRLYRENKGNTCLLYGVTGSGKTQVFLDLVDTVSKEGRSVIVMVPEISLTTQLISIFTARYGGNVAVLHSAMSLGQRMDQWQKIKEGKVKIAVGTRSAVFAPFKDLGLIIIDEEQEHTYKSEKSPRFHTRDIAKFRIADSKGVCVLASATPSIESYTLAVNGKMPMFTLKNRYGNSQLPQVSVVDMREELKKGNSGIISNELYEACKEELKNKRQIILLLNRRGHNTYVSCANCGEVEVCPNCSVSLTYHSANNRLMCHYCGYSKEKQNKCQHCSSEHMRFSGLGTQKAEEEIKLLFPDARVLRLDTDNTMARDSFSTYLGDFAKGEYDILLGTQMVAKGLDFPNVTLVGVLGADSAMYCEDYRSFERSFSLLTQVVGRAGRGDFLGRAIIQTTSSDNDIITKAQNQDYDGFYQDEILSRKLMIYPPYCDICLVSASAFNNDTALETVIRVFENIKKLISNEYEDIKLIILGPSAATIPKVNNKYRYRMIIKCRNNKKFRQMLKTALDIKLSRDVGLSVDFNPESIM